MLENLITNRTPGDVDEVKELAEVIKAGTATEEQVRKYLEEINKGAYTYRDLNRVEEAVRYVAIRLNNYGYLSSVPAIRTWSIGDKPSKSEWDTYFYNVSLLRRSIPVWESTPEAPASIVGFDTNKANALEQILVDVDQILNRMADAWLFSGDIYSAEV